MPPFCFIKMSKLSYLIINLKAFLIGLSANVLLEVFKIIEPLSVIAYFEGFGVHTGSLIFFPLGATILSYYLYGYRALLGVLLIKVLAGFYYNTPNDIFWSYLTIN